MGKMKTLLNFPTFMNLTQIWKNNQNWINWIFHRKLDLSLQIKHNRLNNYFYMTLNKLLLVRGTICHESQETGSRFFSVTKISTGRAMGQDWNSWGPSQSASSQHHHLWSSEFGFTGAPFNHGNSAFSGSVLLPRGGLCEKQIIISSLLTNYQQ